MLLMGAISLYEAQLFTVKWPCLNPELNLQSRATYTTAIYQYFFAVGIKAPVT